jgi:hypothetical protein
MESLSGTTKESIVYVLCDYCALIKNGDTTRFFFRKTVTVGISRLHKRQACLQGPLPYKECRQARKGGANQLRSRDAVQNESCRARHSLREARKVAGLLHIGILVAAIVVIHVFDLEL